LSQGLDYSSINSKYRDKYKNSKDTIALYNAKRAELSAFKASAYSKANLARKEGLKELGNLKTKKGAVTDQEMLIILSNEYQKYINGLKKDYLAFVKSKAGI
jgi:hypothetical protein